jgi:hypothetical protein
MAFGLAITPRVFTKLLRTPIALLRRMGIRLIVYMDDILVMNRSYQGVQSDLQTVVAMMEGLGFLIHRLKLHQFPFLKKSYVLLMVFVNWAGQIGVSYVYFHHPIFG